MRDVKRWLVMEFVSPAPSSCWGEQGLVYQSKVKKSDNHVATTDSHPGRQGRQSALHVSSSRAALTKHLPSDYNSGIYCQSRS
jgi:hypothetical protein